MKAKEELKKKNLGHDVRPSFSNPESLSLMVYMWTVVHSNDWNSDVSQTCGAVLVRRLHQSGACKGPIHSIMLEQTKLILFLVELASVQTVAGTGANRLAAAFLCSHYPAGAPRIYIGMPAWGNYMPLFKHAGLSYETYKYYDAQTRKVDFSHVLGTAAEAPEHSIFVLQGCCNNPSGADLNQEQWVALAQVMKKKAHFAFFDVAYQGFGSGEADGGSTDVWAVRHFARQSIDMLVCQSFSKNMGLYSERAGALHVLCQSRMIAGKVKDCLRSIIRWEFSSAPAYGARLVEAILEDSQLQEQWKRELAAASYRLMKNRERLYHELALLRKTPGAWEFILEDKGLFSLLGLTEQQVEILTSKYHIYLPWNGRINVAGLNELNIPLVADAIDYVVCQEKR